jgi:hypothetical protein
VRRDRDDVIIENSGRVMISSSESHVLSPMLRSMPIGIVVLLVVCGVWVSTLVCMIFRAVVLDERRFRDDVEYRRRTTRPTAVVRRS